MKNAIFLLFLILSVSVCSGQDFSGVLLCTQTGKPVEYANIGIVGKDIGTTTDEKGAFTLALADKYDEETLKVSMIGFEPITMKVADFKHGGKHTLYLSSKTNMLKEVTIKPHDFKHKRLGNNANDKSKVLGFNKYSAGYECGTYMKIKRSPTYIDSLHINIASCTYDSIFLRINVYEDRNGTFVNILDEPIYVSMPTLEALKGISIDLTKRHIVVKEHFMVSAELVKNLGNKELFFCAQLLGHPSYMRLTSQGEWHNMVIGAGFSAYVTY